MFNAEASAFDESPPSTVETRPCDEVTALVLLVTLPSMLVTLESKELNALESAFDETLSLVAFKSLRKDVIELP